MGWETSDRRKHLPRNWAQIRLQVFHRDDYQCCAEDANTGERCTARAEEVDHLGSRTDHSLQNLQSLCSWHHGKKTGRQGAAAARARRARNAAKFSRAERHPGDLS